MKSQLKNRTQLGLIKSKNISIDPNSVKRHHFSKYMQILGVGGEREIQACVHIGIFSAYNRKFSAKSNE